MTDTEKLKALAKEMETLWQEMQASVRNQEFTPDDFPDLFKIKTSPVDGLAYAVFESEADLVAFEQLWPNHFRECDICSFGALRNSFRLGVIQ